MEKREILQALINHYSEGNKANFARKLGISAQGLSTWIARNSFDIEVVFSKCEGLSAEWLLTGKGEMFKERISKTTIPTSPSLIERKDNTNQVIQQDIPLLMDRLLSIISEKDTMIQKQSEEIGRLKEKIDQLKRDLKQERGYNASDADSLDTAIAG